MENKIRSETSGCSHKHSHKHTWELAHGKCCLVLFAAAWAGVRGDITRLAQGHLAARFWRWRWKVSQLPSPALIFLCSFHRLDPPQPKVTEWKLWAPISFYCNDSYEIAISLSAAAHRLGISVRPGWTLGTCVSAQTAARTQEVGPRTAVCPPGRLLCNNARGGEERKKKQKKNRSPFQLSGASLTSCLVNSANVQCVHVRIDPRDRSAPVKQPSGSGFAPPGRHQSDMGKRRGREG